MMERQYNVSKREAPPLKKRKVETAEEDDADNDEQKKSTGTFSATGNGGALGEYLKSEREKGANEPGSSTAPIDLSNEDESDIVYLGEAPGANSREVCLGRIFSEALAHKIPQMPKYQTGKLGKDYWPQARINYRRSPAQNNIIELFDRSGYGNTGSTGSRFGNVTGKLASVLCPLIDGIAVTKMRLKMYLEAYQKKPGEFPGFRISRVLPLSILIYAPRNRADGIGRKLSQYGFFLSNPHGQVDPGLEIYNPHIPKPLGASSTGARKPQSSQPTYGVSRTQEEMLRETTSMFDNLTKAEELPEMEANTELILTPLMSHQKQALHFLTEHERPDNDVSEDGTNFSLWKPQDKKSGRKWYNVVTNHELPQKPEATRGGMLADVMGLGKTLSVLALVAETLDDARQFGDEEPPVDSVDLKRNSKATLIICPKSVMSNWEEQIRTHTKEGRFKVYSYHGSTRTQDVDELADYNIVLSSYNTAAAEFSDSNNRRTALGSIQWFRIVLDEAHQIRNASTHISKACCALSAQRRWALTGTPVQNRLDDLGALIKFLRIKPFDDISAWTHHIIAPFKHANADVLQHLRLLVGSITLRRMKDKVGLTERVEHINRLTFADDEMAIYTQFAQQSGLKFKLMLGGDKRLRGKSYAHVLKSLGRLRAICAHGREMLNEEDLKELEGLTAGTAIDLGDEPGGTLDDTFISEKNAYDTLNMMSESEVDICMSCNRKIGDKHRDEEGVVDLSESEEEGESAESSAVERDDDTMGYLTPCYHLFCPNCKDEYVESAMPNLTEDYYHRCSYCDQYVRFGLFQLKRQALKNMLDARAKANKKGKAKWDETTYSGPHTKVKALLNDLEKSRQDTEQLPADEPPIRSVVFSGWTTYLDLIEYALEERDIGYVRLDGSMSVKARSAVLTTFANDLTVTVLLVSIKAGGQGLNFLAANKVYMMEPQFNPGVEQQAIDRVHRLGQRRDVEIVHYIMRASVEETILGLQEKKEKLARLSLEGRVSKSEEAKARIEELKELFK